MPARLQDIKRVLESLGVTIEMPRSGSHYKAVKGGVMYPIPAHNGMRTEIGDQYIRGLCRAFEIDPQSFKAKL